jgi:GAF domain-containing protein
MTNYQELNLISKSYFSNDKYEITVLSNASALLNQYLEDVSWVGFYLFKDEKLILGPFQGLVACTEIPVGKGVCGKVAATKEVEIVSNVHEFPGHIACDSRSNSEIVLPIFLKGNFYGELDIDSTSFERFNEVDKVNLLEFVKNLQKYLERILLN